MSDETPITLLRDKADYYSKLAAEYRRAADLLETQMPSQAAELRVSTRRRAAADPKKSTMAMIESVLKTASRPLDLPAVTQQMQAQGWQTESVNPSNNVRTAISRMVDRGLVERIGDQFRWRNHGAQDEEVRQFVAAPTTTSESPLL